MKQEHYQEYTDDSTERHLHAVAPGRRGGLLHGQKRWLVVGGAAVLVAAVALLYFFVLSDKTTPKVTAPRASVPADTTPALSAEDAAKPETFKSATLNIEITHRKDWTLRESADKTELIVTSPNTPYVRKDGSSATGVFTVKIRNGATEAMKATIEKMVATQPSEVIAYAAPTENQRHYTNLSYGGTAEAFQFFLVTGSTEFKAGNPFALTLPLDDMFIIAGGFGADSSDALAFDAVPKTGLTNPIIVHAIDIVESLKVF